MEYYCAHVLYDHVLHYIFRQNRKRRKLMTRLRYLYIFDHSHIFLNNAETKEAS